MLDTLLALHILEPMSSPTQEYHHTYVMLLKNIGVSWTKSTGLHFTGISVIFKLSKIWRFRMVLTLRLLWQRKPEEWRMQGDIYVNKSEIRHGA